MDGLGGSSASGVRASDDGEAPTGVLPSVEDDRLGVLEGPRQLLPVHPAGDKVGGAERGLRAVHDAEDDRRTVDGGLQGCHGLCVGQAAEADVVH